MKSRGFALILILIAFAATGCGKQMRDYIAVGSEDLLPSPGGTLNPFSDEIKTVRVSSGYGTAQGPSAKVTVSIGHVNQDVVEGTTADALVRLSHQKMD
ncbi:MAG: hypothetical protein KF681_16905 [Bdellovibrionaceae bacterium]|nr:hypothetical protein [Pseudobdellovibrionaceae bacterium]